MTPTRHKPFAFAAATLLATVVLSACLGSNGGNSPTTTSSESPNPTAAPLSPGALAQAMGNAQQGMLPLGLGCGWLVASDPDKVNIAFPDSQAKYWVAAAPVTPQTRLRIDGAFPKARYFSYNAYDLALRPTDALADFELQPISGTNPFSPNAGTAGAAPRSELQRYTAYLQYGPSPTQNPEASRAPNTFYTGDIALGPAGIPNALAYFMYRVYLSEEGEFFDGGAGLPTLTLETADGKTELGTLPNCAEPFLPNLGGALPPLGLNELVLGLDYPNELVLDFPTASYPPRSNKFFGLGETVGQIVSARLGVEAPGNGAVSLGEGGFLSNVHNAYTSTTFARRYGSLALVRAKAPTTRGQAGVEPGSEDLRYWSLCGNEFATQRFTDCAADQQVPLDAQGYFTVVLSDPADRPANATASNGFLWLPWGPYPDQLLIYRHMLPNPQFEQAIQNVQRGQSLAETMGEFAPVGVYCRPEVFTQSNQPADVFALCSADQAANPPFQAGLR